MPTKSEINFSDMPFHYSIELDSNGQIITERLVIRGVDRNKFIENARALRDELMAIKTMLIEDSVSSKTPVCQIHNVTMSRYSRGNEVWYSHKIGSKWCRGKE